MRPPATAPPAEAQRSLAVRVPRAEGEAARQRLRAAGLLRDDLRPARDGEALLLPVRREALGQHLPGPVEEASFVPQAPLRPRYQELVQVPAPLRPLLPTSFDVVGDILVVKLADELLPHGPEIGRALLAAHPQARTVLLDEGVRGRDRVRRVRALAGEDRTTAEHLEYGIRLKVDLARAYFSPRLAGEHHRVAEQVQEGEVVLDLFAGVGPFAIHAARTGNPRRVVAVDINPAAVQLISENAARNGVAGKVEAVCAEASEAARTLAGACDRVIMNLPHGADAFWEAALQACKPQATVHYHRILEREAVEPHVQGLLARAAAAGWDAREQARRVVRAYSPAMDHVAVDFQVTAMRSPARGATP